MRKEFRFLLQSARINLALVAGYAAVLTLGAILFPAPEGERNLFYNYFISAPITVSFILFIMSFSMGANNLNISLHTLDSTISRPQRVPKARTVQHTRGYTHRGQPPSSERSHPQGSVHRSALGTADISSWMAQLVPT